MHAWHGTENERWSNKLYLVFGVVRVLYPTASVEHYEASKWLCQGNWCLTLGASYSAHCAGRINVPGRCLGIHKTNSSKPSVQMAAFAVGYNTPPNTLLSCPLGSRASFSSCRLQGWSCADSGWLCMCPGWLCIKLDWCRSESCFRAGGVAGLLDSVSPDVASRPL